MKEALAQAAALAPAAIDTSTLKGGLPTWVIWGGIVAAIVAIASLGVMLMGVRMIYNHKKGTVKDAGNQSAIAGIGMLWIVAGAAGFVIPVVAATVGYFINASA